MTSDAPAASARLDPVPGEWRRVSPKYIVVDLVGNLISGVVSTFAASLPVWLLDWGQWWWLLTVGVGVVSLALVALTPRRVRSIGYLLREDDLLFRRGIMFQRFVAVPFGRMQLVDITRGPLARALGLAELKLVTAAAATGVVIPGLALDDAEELRDHLVALAETRRAGL
ncbi:MAG: PH domain-containing protein [Protaetiibacter sp.]